MKIGVFLRSRVNVNCLYVAFISAARGTEDHARAVFDCQTAKWWAPMTLTLLAHAYEVRPRKDKRGVDLISDALPFGRLW